jgi:hypothetical protein
MHTGSAFSPAQVIKSYKFITANLSIIFIHKSHYNWYVQHIFIISSTIATCASPVSSQLVFHKHHPHYCHHSNFINQSQWIKNFLSHNSY